MGKRIITTENLEEDLKIEGELRPQRFQTADGGVDVLGVGKIVHKALPLRQSGGDEEPVRLRFGGRRGDRAAQGGGCDGDVHASSSNRRDFSMG